MLVSCPLVLAMALGAYVPVPVDEVQRLVRHHVKDVERTLHKKGYNALFSEFWTPVRAEKQTVHGVNHRITLVNEYTQDVTYCVLVHTDLAQVSRVEDVLLQECDAVPP